MKNSNNLGLVQKTVVGAQFLFVAFGATVLVPLLVGMDPSVALFTAGVGTLIFHLITKGKVPVFLGSSFAFIAPIIKASELYGLAGALSGLVAVGAVYGVMSLIIRLRGVGFITRLFPPVVVGPVIMLIGLLSKTAILITEFASEKREQGMSLAMATYSATKERFRPILMTVLTMVIGMVPLMFSTGVGANGNTTIGTGVVGGMLIGTLALLFVLPALFIFFQWLQEKVKPIKTIENE